MIIIINDIIINILLGGLFVWIFRSFDQLRLKLFDRNTEIYLKIIVRKILQMELSILTTNSDSTGENRQSGNTFV